MGRRSELVAYVPVIHRGYIGLFERCRDEVGSLLVMGEELVGQFLKYREIRAVPAESIAAMARGLGYFEEIGVLEGNNMSRLVGKQIVMPDEDVSRRFAQKYLKPEQVKFENVFLRWNEENVTSSQKVRADRVSSDEFDRRMMKFVEQEAAKSSDWWRHIGAVIVRDRQVLLAAHNEHVPTEQTQYVEGDPRDVIKSGTNNLLYSSVHAEQRMVAEAAGKGIKIGGTDLYINVFPCPECTKLVAHAGVRSCFFKSGSAWLNSDEVMRSFGTEIVKVVD